MLLEQFSGSWGVQIVISVGSRIMYGFTVSKGKELITLGVNV